MIPLPLSPTCREGILEEGKRRSFLCKMNAKRVELTLHPAARPALWVVWSSLGSHLEVLWLAEFSCLKTTGPVGPGRLPACPWSARGTFWTVLCIIAVFPKGSQVSIKAQCEKKDLLEVTESEFLGLLQENWRLCTMEATRVQFRAQKTEEKKKEAMKSLPEQW